MRGILQFIAVSLIWNQENDSLPQLSKSQAPCHHQRLCEGSWKFEHPHHLQKYDQTVLDFWIKLKSYYKLYARQLPTQKNNLQSAVCTLHLSVGNAKFHKYCALQACDFFSVQDAWLRKWRVNMALLSPFVTNLSLVDFFSSWDYCVLVWADPISASTHCI